MPSNQNSQRMSYAMAGIDVESQWPATSWGRQAWSPLAQHNTENEGDGEAVETSHTWLAGVILFLFLAGVLPLTLMVFGLFCVLCLATCFRAYMLHQYAQRLNQSSVGSGLDTMLRLLRTPSGFALLFAGQSINMANLRLSLLDRDFNETDYEALLELDHHVAADVRPRLSDAELRTLRTHVHGKASCEPSTSCCRKPGQSTSPSPKEGASQECSVCLESYGEGARITTLPCSHCFHADCIEPWLRQQGTAATCPLCKRIVFHHAP